MHLVSNERERGKLTLNEVSSDVDDDASRLEPFGLDEVGLADGSDDDVGILEL